jgi:hypothetical protein
VPRGFCAKKADFAGVYADSEDLTEASNMTEPVNLKSPVLSIWSKAAPLLDLLEAAREHERRRSKAGS